MRSLNTHRPWFQSLAQLLSAVMLLNPVVSVAGQLAVDGAAGGNTRIGAAANGVPVIDIATPDAAGLSHNQFAEYNVGSRGLILNNAADKLQATELGGYIQGNANLNGQSASLILNEVTGSNRSVLKGYVEVAGASAQVIVANPHGITCDGCGFINTPKATLTTGTPVVQDGKLKSYSVDGGDILIDGVGVDARNLDAFELIARSARINAELHAKKLDVVAGRNKVDASTLEAAAKADDGSARPMFAIDSSALGGMYAGAIKLVGTEDGVGSKLSGDMASSSADIAIDANGQLTVTRAASGRDLTLSAKSIELVDNNYAAGKVAITAKDSVSGSIKLATDKALTSGKDLILAAAQITSQSKVLAGIDAQGNSNASARLTLQADNIDNSGELVSQGALHLTAKQQLNNQGAIQSADATQITAQKVANQGRIVSNKNLQLQGEYSTNQGLIASGENLSLLGKTLSNQSGAIFSLGNVLIAQAKNHSLVAMDLLENRSGSIESSGDMQLQVNTLINRKERFEQTHKLISGQIDVICYDCSGDHHNVDYLAKETFATEVIADSQAARIHSGGHLLITSDTLKNHYSTLSAANDIHITANELQNLGATSGTIQREQRFNSGRVTDGTNKRFIWYVINPYNAAEAPKELPKDLYQWRLLSDIETRIASGLAAPAIIQSGGTLNIQAANSLYNESQLLDNRPTTGKPLTVQFNPPLAADIRQSAINPFALPEGTAGLFGRSGGNRYLIETNPTFASLRNFLNSDYLLNQIGYHADDNLRRLGDGLYEQRLIGQAITRRTGKRFIEGFNDDEAQFKYLMDNALESTKALQLTPGIALTTEQTAALTHDIVWLEKQTIGDETVLAPVLYLAQAKDLLTPSGALLQGQDLNLISGQALHNSGTLKATNHLQATAHNLNNSGGLIEADKTLQLIAKENLHNQQGGIIKSETVNLYAGNDLINERSVASQTLNGQGFSQTTSRSGSTARIEATGKLNLMAGNDIKTIGAAIQSAGDTQLIAGNNLIITAQQEVQQSVRQDKHHSWNNQSVIQHGSNIQVTGNLTAQAGQDILISASQVKATENIALKAGGDILISAAANEQSSDYRYRSNRKRINAENTQIEQQATQIEAGQNLSIEANNNFIISASELKSGHNAYLYAGDQLALLAAQNQHYSLYEKNQKGVLGSKQQRRDEQTAIQNIGTQITTGGDLTLKSQGHQLYQNAYLQSEGDIQLDSGAQIAFEAVKDLHQESHTKSKNGALWQSAQGKGQTDETLNQTALLAKGELLIKAVDGLHIDIKNINEKSVSQTIEAMVKVDPDLAWLKQAEQRGDINWRQVKEIHDRFHYKHQGMGGAAMIIVAIAVAVLTYGAASGAIGAAAGATAGSGSAMAAAGTVTTVTAGVASTTAVSAGWANVALTAVATSMASNAAISTINNQGDLGKAFKDVTSSNALKGYLAAAITAGLISSAGGVLPDAVTGASNASLETWQNLPGFIQHELFNQATAAVVNKAILNQDIETSNLLQATLANSFAAAGFKLVGDIGSEYNLKEGSASKVAMHAIMGGLAAEATGGDFKTGALAAGANELLVAHLDQHYQDLPTDDRNRLLEMNSKIIGVLAATAQGNIDPENLKTAAWVAENGTRYNYLFHDEIKNMLAEKEACKEDKQCKRNVLERYATLDEERNNNISNLCEQSPTSCNDVLVRLASEEDAVFKLIKEQPDARDRFSLGATVPFSNTHAINRLVGELSEDSDFEKAFATAMLAMATGGAGRVTLNKKDLSQNNNEASAGKTDSHPIKQVDNVTRPSSKDSENYVADALGGTRRQVSYKNGKEVSYGTPGSVRPDCVNGACSYEVKNYDIGKNPGGLVSNIAKQVKERAVHLPKGMEQQVVIDIRGQVVTQAQKQKIMDGVVKRTNEAIKSSNIHFIE